MDKRSNVVHLTEHREVTLPRSIDKINFEERVYSMCVKLEVANECESGGHERFKAGCWKVGDSRAGYATMVL